MWAAESKELVTDSHFSDVAPETIPSRAPSNAAFSTEQRIECMRANSIPANRTRKKIGAVNANSTAAFPCLRHLKIFELFLVTVLMDLFLQDRQRRGKSLENVA